jgi:hypothetical protein
MSNMASEITYVVGKEHRLWPNRSEMQLKETAKLLRQVYPDQLQLDGQSNLTNSNDIQSEIVKQTYLDLGPATRSVINVPDNKN